MTFSNPTIAKMCDMLISYHVHSFRVRRAPIFDVEVTPVIVEELDNLRWRVGNEYEHEEQLMKASGLHEIVSRNRYAIKEQASLARDEEDARPHFAIAEKLMSELGAATYLLELLNA